MKKTDYILIAIILILNTTLLFAIPTVNSNSANVVYDGKIVMKIDLKTDDVYIIDAYNGEVEVTVKNGLVAITRETSPRHICAKQGYVNVNVVPLICLPNKLIIEGNESEVDGVSQ